MEKSYSMSSNTNNNEKEMLKTGYEIGGIAYKFVPFPLQTDKNAGWF